MSRPPAGQREMGRGVTARLVFGWAALREKLLAQQAGLDAGFVIVQHLARERDVDAASAFVALELMKIAVLRSVPGAPLGDHGDLRLAGADAETLTLHWLDDRTELPSQALPVPRAVYDGVVADAAGWQALRGDLQAGLFVDMKRLFVGAAAGGAA